MYIRVAWEATLKKKLDSGKAAPAGEDLVIWEYARLRIRSK
jgi:hypothetical protein